jgi:ubiquinone/menaquinone biosynthesis C-methylase UbiE
LLGAFNILRLNKEDAHMNAIRESKKRYWFSRLFTAVLLAGLWRIFSRRTQERTPSLEAIDDPEVAHAFNWVSGTPQMHWMRRFVISQSLRLTKQGQAVDLGCGAGQLVMEMAQNTPGLNITGIDLSDDLLANARVSAQQLGLLGGQVDFRLGNAEEIPFPNQSLDLVISTVSLHHWSEPVKVLNEIDRVLKPGGAFYIFDLRRDMAPPFYLLIWFATQFIVPAALHQMNEPMGSRNASYTVQELVDLAQISRLHGWKVTTGPLWIILAGKKSDETTT